jgi:hypothetical protein
MTELFLIAHKVRGEPAFDVASQSDCPECDAQGCHECDGLGYWWIIPTSGHRAYPWWSANLLDINDTYELSLNGEPTILDHPGPMPPSLPDHYPTRAAPTVSLAEALGFAKPKPATLPPIVRRL